MMFGDQRDERPKSDGVRAVPVEQVEHPSDAFRSQPLSRAEEVVVDGTRFRIPEEALEARVFSIQVLGGRWVDYKTSHRVAVAHDVSNRSPLVKVHTEMGTFDCEPVSG